MHQRLNEVATALPQERCAEMIDGTQWASELGWAQIETLSQYFSPFSVPAEQALFQEGDPGDTLFLLTTGRLAVEKAEKQLAVLTAGRSFGEMAIIDTENRSATVITLEGCEIVAMEKRDFEHLIEDHPRLAVQLLLKISRIISQRLRMTNSALLD